VHKGNSGGPILDQAGNVIGIVTAKLDALAVQKRSGDLPQGEWSPLAAAVAPLPLGVAQGNLPDREDFAGARLLALDHCKHFVYSCLA
jgi:hypothetical protein